MVRRLKSFVVDIPLPSIHSQAHSHLYWSSILIFILYIRYCFLMLNQKLASTFEIDQKASCFTFVENSASHKCTTRTRVHCLEIHDRHAILNPVTSSVLNCYSDILLCAKPLSRFNHKIWFSCIQTIALYLAKFMLRSM